MANNVSEFIKKIMGINYDDKKYIYVYRGHANSAWELEPSIYRPTKLIKNEHNLFDDCIIAKPVEFGECRYTVDYLAKMQHYGLPTRLLDVTYDPLVALFFVVQDRNKKMNGEVICLKIPKEMVKSYSSDTVSILANTAKLKYARSSYKIPDDKDCLRARRGQCSCSSNPNYCKLRCDKFYEEEKNESIHYLQYEINSEKPHFKKMINPVDINSVVCVQAKLQSPRIINQSGLFLLFGIGENNKKMPQIQPDWVESKIIIPSGKKKTIVDELKRLKISSSFVYPELPNVIEEIKKRYK
ncbi:hypothetical protein FACS189485_05440 [Spirochaetia bacterium]|nr:hypothetical protein FACS189485_05440 [Spirochaetia bacterium]